MTEVLEYLKAKYGLPVLIIEPELLNDLKDLGYDKAIELSDLADIWYEFYKP